LCQGRAIVCDFFTFLALCIVTKIDFAKRLPEMFDPLSRSHTPLPRMLVAVIAGATMLAAMALNAIQADAANELKVKYDQSQLLRLARPVAEIIIGNPTIADVSVQSKQLLVITGKSFGHTNMILLDAEKNVIQESRVVVVRDRSSIVTLHRGVGRESYNCTPRCNPTITVGDATAYFKTTAETAGLKMRMSESSTGGNSGGGQ